MYLPRHFTMSGLPQIHAFVDAAGAADLVTFDGTRPVATLLPVIWECPADPAGIGAAEGDGRAKRDGSGEAEPGSLGRLLGHLAFANDQWQTASPGAEALAIVHGPQAYISPSWYESTARHGRTVPTWNYEAVHLTGPLTVHRDPDWLRDVVTRLTSRYEDFRTAPWAVTDPPPEYFDAQLKGIVGVELTIVSVEAKQKLSQNRSTEDQIGAIKGLRSEPGSGPAAIAARMTANLPAGTDPA